MTTEQDTGNIKEVFMRKIIFLSIIFVIYFSNIVYAKKIIYPENLELIDDPEIVVTDIYNLIENGTSRNTHSMYESYSNADDIKKRVDKNRLLQRIGENILLELDGASKLKVDASLAELSKYYYSNSKKTVLAVGVFKVGISENYSSSVSFSKSQFDFDKLFYNNKFTATNNISDIYIPFLFIASENIENAEGLLLDNEIFKTLDEYHNSNLYKLIKGKLIPDKTQNKTQDKTQDELSSWALSSKYYIDRYVPSDMLNNYKANITRKEFAKVAVSFYIKILEEKITKMSDQKPEDFEQQLVQKFEETYFKTNRRYVQNVFIDTNDYFVNLAYAFGIVNGFSGYYYPDNNISREEASVLVSNIVKLLDVYPNSDVKVFKDVTQTSFAFDSIGMLSSIKTADGNAIMQGITEDLFDPKGLYTREQAYVTITKLVKAFYK